ncbi:MAG: type II secretion system protein [Ruminococcaceae bacterium]|nr:type II secretion system protein [Oscillospiraceae bacterium]
MIRCKRKGITLSEICIVLAVVSIVSLAVVSFAAMATGRGATGTDKLKVMQDIELLEAMVDNWFNTVYNSGESAVIDTGETSVNNRALYFENGNLYINTDGKYQSYRFETVTKLEFEIMKNAENNDEIFFCTVTYAYRRGQNTPVDETYTFCINPRVGESIPVTN